MTRDHDEHDHDFSGFAIDLSSLLGQSQEMQDQRIAYSLFMQIIGYEDPSNLGRRVNPHMERAVLSAASADRTGAMQALDDAAGCLYEDDEEPPLIPERFAAIARLADSCARMLAIVTSFENHKTEWMEEAKGAPSRLLIRLCSEWVERSGFVAPVCACFRDSRLDHRRPGGI
jgi:hypothetical protein